jgi:hypothetical protein
MKLPFVLLSRRSADNIARAIEETYKLAAIERAVRIRAEARCLELEARIAVLEAAVSALEPATPRPLTELEQTRAFAHDVELIASINTRSPGGESS